MDGMGIEVESKITNFYLNSQSTLASKQVLAALTVHFSRSLRLEWFPS